MEQEILNDKTIKGGVSKDVLSRGFSEKRDDSDIY